MTKLRCCFCQQELEIGGVDGILRGCPKCRNLGTEMLWQELIDSMKEHDLCHDALVKQTKELDRTEKTLEQSETCCTEWEKQALDYKAENIALSGDLERTRKALDVAKLILKNLLPYLDGYERLDVEKSLAEIKQITEQKDEQC